MSISVRIPTILRPYTQDKKIVEAEGFSVAEVVNNLEKQFPGIGARLLENGALRKFINVYINDDDVRFLNGIDSPTKDGDSITILPAVAGG